MWLILTILALVGVILLHAALRRVAPLGNSVVQFLGIAVLGAGACALILPLTHASALEWLTALALLGFCCELYLFLFTFAISSVSLAILLEKAGHRPGTTEPAAHALTPAVRVQRLQESGLLVRVPAGFALTPFGRAIVRVRNALQTFFRHGS